MDNEDNDFFILVLGVLAAVIMMVSWWYTSNGNELPVATIAAAKPSAEADSGDHSDDDQSVDEDSGDEASDDDDQAESDVAATAEPDDEPAATFGADSSDEDDDAADSDDPADAEIELAATPLDALLNNPDLSVITNLMREEGLSELLGGAEAGAFTVFAPTNDAINQAASSDTTVAVLERDRESVLAYHVVPGSYTFDQLTELARGSRSAQLQTLQGEPLGFMLEGGTIVINGNTMLTGDTTETDSGAVHALDNVLVPPVAALNAIVEAEPILFASGSATIEQDSFATIDRFIEILNANDVSVSVEGHTDSSGDPILNQNLSQSRARSVLNYMVANGIDETRLSAVGYGAGFPVADNNTEEGRALNRRIEFTLD